MVSNQIKNKRPKHVLLGGHLKDLISGASVAMFFKIIGVTAALFFNLILAKTFGAEKAGLFFIAISVVEIISLFGRIGLAQSIIAFVGIYSAKKEWRKMKGTFNLSLLVIIIASLLTSLCLYFLSPFFANYLFDEQRLISLFRIVSFSILPISLYCYFGNALKGLQKIKDSQFVLTFCQQLFLLLGMLIIFRYNSIEFIAFIFFISNTISAIFGYILWRKRTPQLLGISSDINSNQIFKKAIPLFWSTLLLIINARSGTVFLGMLSEPADVGIFNISFRIAMLTSFALMAVDAISSPKFASLNAKRDFEQLAIVARQSTLLLIVINLPIIVFVLSFPNFILSFFGPQFSGHGCILSIMTIGQCFNVASGPVGMLLAMTGREKKLRNLYLIATPLNIILQYLLISNFGLFGAACAMAISVIVLNTISVCIVKKELGFLPMPIPGLRRIRLFIKRVSF